METNSAIHGFKNEAWLSFYILWQAKSRCECSTLSRNIHSPHEHNQGVYSRTGSLNTDNNNRVLSHCVGRLFKTDNSGCRQKIGIYLHEMCTMNKSDSPLLEVGNDERCECLFIVVPSWLVRCSSSTLWSSELILKQKLIATSKWLHSNTKWMLHIRPIHHILGMIHYIILTIAAHSSKVRARSCKLLLHITTTWPRAAYRWDSLITSKEIGFCTITSRYSDNGRRFTH